MLGTSPKKVLPLVVDTPAGADLALGVSSAGGGKTAVAAMEWAIAAAQRGEVDAVVTAPVSKTSLKLAGYDYPGQTEFFAERCGVPSVAMMLAGPTLRVVLVTTHMALTDAIKKLTPGAVVRTAKIADEALTRLLGKKPRLGLCALNPHAGEGGLFGDEEITKLAPAITGAAQIGVTLEGPYPADTLFVHAVRGKYDAVIVLYHDQGLIPLKLLHFDEGVNVTLGLPIIRTSPDHGTAFDIAGRGIAEPTSMLAAIRMATDFIRAGRPRVAASRESTARKRRPRSANKGSRPRSKK
jgi:4-hydroxythreonine-4-phosphate dehydrogenase